MKFVVDIDGTICTLAGKDSDYTEVSPVERRIRHLNSLYESGHTIVYFTARGMGRTNGDSSESHDLFYELTKAQLAEWGVKHHELILGKPTGDVYIDDKGVNVKDFFAD